ncbi:MAG: serine hydrolase [Limnothrix sp.]
MTQSSPPPEGRRRPRRSTLISPWLFLVLSTGVAIAILGGGLWLLQRFADRSLENQTTDQAPLLEAQPEDVSPTAKFTLPDAVTTLTTELLPSIAVDESALDTAVTVKRIWKYRYNVALLPNWTYSPELELLIDEIRAQAATLELSASALSVVLIDLKQGAIAYHQPEVTQYPASVAKLFWMVALYGQFQQDLLTESDFQKEIRSMVQRSDNNASSRIVDAITRTEFQAQGSASAYQTWYLQRQQLNQFFTQAGYKNLNITQKTYPIPDIEIEEPTGFDLQMRYDPLNPDQPIRNQLSAWHAARMMYEIASQQAIAPEASQKMLQFLKRDLNKDWQTPTNYFNPVQDFFGAGLPTDTLFYSKAGWTTQGRHEVAYITSPDGEKQYILSIFADDESYAKDDDFFPSAARLIHSQITTIQNEKKLSQQN